MHLTLKKEATNLAGRNLVQQRDKFDAFKEAYNFERPHQALNRRFPAEVYLPSKKSYLGLPEVDYPFHDQSLLITHCGRICLRGMKIHLTTALANQKIGIKEVHDRIWLVSFMNYDLGHFDEEERKLQP